MITTAERKLLSRERAAKYLGVRPGTLAAWASDGRYNLPYAKIGSRCMYRVEDLDAFIDARTVRHEVPR